MGWGQRLVSACTVLAAPSARALQLSLDASRGRGVTYRAWKSMIDTWFGLVVSELSWGRDVMTVMAMATAVVGDRWSGMRRGEEEESSVAQVSSGPLFRSSPLLLHKIRCTAQSGYGSH